MILTFLTIWFLIMIVHTACAQALSCFESTRAIANVFSALKINDSKHRPGKHMLKAKNLPVVNLSIIFRLCTDKFFAYNVSFRVHIAVMILLNIIRTPWKVLVLQTPQNANMRFATLRKLTTLNLMLLTIVTLSPFL